MNGRGSVLIAAIWTLAVLSLLTLSAAFYAAGDLAAARKQTLAARGSAVFTAAARSVVRSFAGDPDRPMGRAVLPVEWEKDLRVFVGDESGKLPLGAVSGESLTVLFGTLKRQGDLALEPAALTDAIVRYRAAKPFEVLEELRFLPGVDEPAFEVLGKHLTPYGTRPNMNTMTPEAFNALLEPLASDPKDAERLAAAVLQYRKAGHRFRDEHASAEALAAALGLPRSPEMVALLGRFLPTVSFRPEFLRVEMEYRSRRKAEAVLRVDRGGEVLFWHESPGGLRAA